MSEPRYVAETLAWCNERRAEKQKKPLKKLPKGIPADGYSCPCGKAINAWVGSKDYETSHGDFAGVPRAVGRFVRAFDNGRFPQYEAKP